MYAGLNNAWLAALFMVVIYLNDELCDPHICINEQAFDNILILLLQIHLANFSLLQKLTHQQPKYFRSWLKLKNKPNLASPG